MIALATMVFLANVAISLRRRVPAGDDPWQAHTLEWATSSPPPRHNFAELPPIRSLRAAARSARGGASGRPEGPRMKRAAVVVGAWGVWLGVWTAMQLVFPHATFPERTIQWVMLGGASAAALLTAAALWRLDRAHPPRTGATPPATIRSRRRRWPSVSRSPSSARASGCSSS